jgi:outer membrane protein assembly factor BamB
MRSSRRAWALGVALLVSDTFAAVNEWTRFRGSDGSGMAPGAQPPVEWSGTTNLRWKAELPGPGASSPIRFGDAIFVTCFSGFGENGRSEGDLAQLKRHLVCLDATSGKIRWTASVPAAPGETSYTRLAEHGYASHTPATDGERVYVLFGKSGVLAFGMDGRRLWQADVGRESGRQGFGSAASLVLHKDLVIVNAAEESRSIRALDRVTGRERWRAEGTGFANVYNTPLQLTLPDGRQELVVAVQNKVWGLDPDTGKERWFATAPISGNLAASVVAADGVLYAFSGNQRPGTVAIRAGGSGDVTQTHILWTSPRGPDFGTPVIHEGHLYFATARGMAVCVDAKTGAEIFNERLGGGRGGVRSYASPVLADGKWYLPTRNAGTFVFAAKPAFAQLARNVVEGDTSDFSATPMLAGREIFLRSNRALYCFATGPGGAGGN